MTFEPSRERVNERVKVVRVVKVVKVAKVVKENETDRMKEWK